MRVSNLSAGGIMAPAFPRPQTERRWWFTASVHKAIQCNQGLCYLDLSGMLMQQDLIEYFRENVRCVDNGIEAPTLTRPERERRWWWKSLAVGVIIAIEES
jgi:hypothetical protein